MQRWRVVRIIENRGKKIIFYGNGVMCQHWFHEQAIFSFTDGHSSIGVGVAIWQSVCRHGGKDNKMEISVFFYAYQLWNEVFRSLNIKILSKMGFLSFSSPMRWFNSSKITFAGSHLIWNRQYLTGFRFLNLLICIRISVWLSGQMIRLWFDWRIDRYHVF